MPIMGRDDLEYEYTWTTTPGDSPNHIHSPDNKLLNRAEGYEVLYFINEFLEDENLTTKASGKKAEWLIQEHLPDEIRDRYVIQLWLRRNWDRRF
ncbi:hypothetical protein [Caenispirillum salinarum]|uniref:hypothetical protein n=1 Tax=Caenispirillum salinarum TaxID=859058 RepID=UPI00384D202A